jgi:hypothetical protein
MPVRRVLLSATFVAAALSMRPAAAQEAGAAYASPAAEIAALQAQMGQALSQLSSGCAVACPALGSMERAAARICALDPGPRCTEARAKVRDAATRVRRACGECRDQGGAPLLDDRKKEDRDGEEKPAAPLSASPQPPPPPVVAPRPAEAPAREVQAAAPAGRGGCAACTISADPQGALGATVSALFAAIALGGRRSRRRRPVSKRRDG